MVQLPAGVPRLASFCLARVRIPQPHFKGRGTLADEKVRVIAFDAVDLDDGDWDGPNPRGEFLTYTSKHGAASIRVTKVGKVVLDGDFGAQKTVLIDDDVIHLPEGLGREI
jgi:hypothetical protein